MSVIKFSIKNKKLCISMDTGMSSRSFAQSRQKDCFSEKGFILRDARVIPFQFEKTELGIRNGKESVFLTAELSLPELEYEESVNVQTLYANILQHLYEKNTDNLISESDIQAVQNVLEIFSRILFAKEEISELFLTELAAAGTQSIAFLKETIILLPPITTKNCLMAQPKAEKLDYLSAVHPFAEKVLLKESFGFLIAGTLYYLLCGNSAYGKGIKNENTLFENMLDSFFDPPNTLIQNISQNDSDLLSFFLKVKKNKKEKENLVAFFDRLFSLPERLEKNQENLLQDREAFYLQRERILQQQQKSIQKKRFLRKHRTKLTVGFFAFLTLSLIFASIIYKQNSAPDTKGLTSLQVVEGFYTAVAELNQEISSAYATRNGGGKYESLMMNLYVIKKTREGYEQRKIYFTPQELAVLCDKIKEKQPSASFEEFCHAVKKIMQLGSVYGITDLKITVKEENPSQTVFDVLFFYWLPTPSDAQSKLSAEDPFSPKLEEFGFPVQVYHKHDTVCLQLYKDRWLISSIDSQERLVAEDGKNILKAFFKESEKADYLP
ncbi:MAG: hypothetical protein P1P67_06445 [Treponema phagedenis]|uniref:hypothetical protein n=1 Tax=Treponema phagedenis TaxID=162 RepID=UPI003133E6EF